MQTAHAVESRVLVELSEHEGVKYAVVDLHGDGHHGLYRHYESLPNVIECNGTFYGKSGWDSDRCKAYYRSDKASAKWRNLEIFS